MSDKRSYLAAAFNARPFGMPIPPNWFGVVAFALLGAFVNPGFWLIGAGLEGLYLWALSKNPRFRALVDSSTVDASWRGRPWHCQARRLHGQACGTVKELPVLQKGPGLKDLALFLWRRLNFQPSTGNFQVKARPGGGKA